MTTAAKGSRWYPSQNQLRDPVTTERSFRQVLDQLYALADSHAALTKKVAGMESASSAAAKSAEKSPFPPGSGPTDSAICGLRVAPVDTASLADGTKLTFVKAANNLQFM
jgi:hypothetical protein